MWDDEQNLNPNPITESYNFPSERIYEDRFLTLSTIPSRFGPYITLQHSGNDAGVVVVLHSRGKILLVQQVRYPVGEEIWELPRGSVMAGETAAKAAAREAGEETGISIYETDNLQSLGFMYSDSGVITTKIELFYSHIDDTYFTEGDLIETENASWFPIEQIKQAIRDDKIRDNFTVAALYRAELAGLLVEDSEDYLPPNRSVSSIEPTMLYKAMADRIPDDGMD